MKTTTKSTTNHARAGFTLIEVLAVIVILGI
jgi:prepilin-type N-terminal cleavage/methylation domain-containing protein